MHSLSHSHSQTYEVGRQYITPILQTRELELGRLSGFSNPGSCRDRTGTQVSCFLVFPRPLVSALLPPRLRQELTGAPISVADARRKWTASCSWSHFSLSLPSTHTPTPSPTWCCCYCARASVAAGSCPPLLIRCQLHWEKPTENLVACSPWQTLRMWGCLPSSAASLDFRGLFNTFPWHPTAFVLATSKQQQWSNGGPTGESGAADQRPSTFINQISWSYTCSST